MTAQDLSGGGGKIEMSNKSRLAGLWQDCRCKCTATYIIAP